jgi:hypothetical protein
LVPEHGPRSECIRGTAVAAGGVAAEAEGQPNFCQQAVYTARPFRVPAGVAQRDQSRSRSLEGRREIEFQPLQTRLRA